MRPSVARLFTVVGVGVLLVSAMGGCSSPGTNGKTLLTVGNRPPASQAAARDAYDKVAADFQAANPDIQLKTVETTWDATTFQALLAGGQMPDVMYVPFTEPAGLIARKQVADITAQVKQEGLDTVLNPSTLAVVQDASKNVYGLPTSAYAMGLTINRDLFTKAGLDPDNPPQTWDQVRAAAKQIHDKTGAAGFAQLSTKNQGGWIFTTMVYSFGGLVEDQAGTKAVFADTSAATKALQLIHDMKWTDKSMNDQNLYEANSLVQDFAAGKLGMFVGAPDWFEGATVQNKMPPENFGQGPMPLYGSVPRTSLTGGSVQVVSPKASDAQKLAAVKYIKFALLGQYLDQQRAVTLAKGNQASGIPVAVPHLPVVSQQQYDTYLGWVAPYNNVPTKNFESYVKALPTLKLMPEPVNSAQKVYAALDSVIQTVLTKSDADIPSLVKDAQSSVTAQLSQ